MPYSYIRDVWAMYAPRNELLSTLPWFTRAPHPGSAERGSGWTLHSSLHDKLSAERRLQNAAFRQLVRVVTSVLVDVNLEILAAAIGLTLLHTQMLRRNTLPDHIIALQSLAGCEAPLLGKMTAVMAGGRGRRWTDLGMLSRLG